VVDHDLGNETTTVKKQVRVGWGKEEKLFVRRRRKRRPALPRP
jgi:hypothetical protein